MIKIVLNIAICVQSYISNPVNTNLDQTIYFLSIFIIGVCIYNEVLLLFKKEN